MALNASGPLVSVLVPVYNTAPYLRECLDSIAGQTYGKLHIVVADDGSTDTSGDICREYARRDTRIEYHPGPHGGIASVRNRLLALARGEYTVFVDSDDRIDACMIARMVERAESDRLDILVAGCRTTNVTLGRQQSIAYFLSGSTMPSSLWAKIVRTALYRKTMFDPRIEYGEDVMMTWRLLNAADRVGLTADNHYHYRDTPGSLTHGLFTDRTCSLRLVWETIAAECASLGPDLRAAASRQLAYCYVWLLYTALRTGTPRDHRIAALQRALHRHLSHIVTDAARSVKCRAFALGAAWLYTPTRMLLAPIRQRLNPLR